MNRRSVFVTIGAIAFGGVVIKLPGNRFGGSTGTDSNEVGWVEIQNYAEQSRNVRVRIRKTSSSESVLQKRVIIKKDSEIEFLNVIRESGRYEITVRLDTGEKRVAELEIDLGSGSGWSGIHITVDGSNKIIINSLVE